MQSEAASAILRAFVARRHAEGAVERIERYLEQSDGEPRGGSGAGRGVEAGRGLRGSSSPAEVGIRVVESGILQTLLSDLACVSNEQPRRSCTAAAARPCTAARSASRAAHTANSCPDWRPPYAFSTEIENEDSHGEREALRAARTTTVLSALYSALDAAAGQAPIRSATPSIGSISDQEGAEQRSIATEEAEEAEERDGMSVTSSAAAGREEDCVARAVDELGGSSLVPLLRSAFLVDSPSYVLDRREMYQVLARVVAAMARNWALAPLLGDLPDGSRSVAEQVAAFVDGVGAEIEEEEAAEAKEVRGRGTASDDITPLCPALRSEYGGAPPKPCAAGKGDAQERQLVLQLAHALSRERCAQEASEGGSERRAAAAAAAAAASKRRRRRTVRRGVRSGVRKRPAATSTADVRVSRKALERAAAEAEAAVGALRREVASRTAGPYTLSVALREAADAVAPLAAEAAEARDRRCGREEGKAPAAVEAAEPERALPASSGAAMPASEEGEGGREAEAEDEEAGMKVDEDGESIPESAVTVLRAEECGRGDESAPDELRSRYEEQLRPLLFASDRMEGGADAGSVHSYAEEAATETAEGPRVKRLRRELRGLRRMLPLHFDSSIALRVDERRPYLLRALIAAPDNTPYDSGCFQFDIYVPPQYPRVPPKVQLMTTGGGRVRFNPNLYECGKVCLSLLGTWSGPGWDPQTSNLFQVLVSIQAQILGAKFPVYNEPGYEGVFDTSRGARFQRVCENGGYERLRVGTLRWAVADQAAHPSPGFSRLVRLHLWLKRNHIARTSLAWVRQAICESDTRDHVAELQRARRAALRAIQAAAEEEGFVSKCEGVGGERTAFQRALSALEAREGLWEAASADTVAVRHRVAARRKALRTIAHEAVTKANGRKRRGKAQLPQATALASGAAAAAAAEPLYALPLPRRNSVAEVSKEDLETLAALPARDYEALLVAVQLADGGASRHRARTSLLRRGAVWVPRALLDLTQSVVKRGRHYTTLSQAPKRARDALRDSLRAQEAGDEAAASSALAQAADAGLEDAAAVAADLDFEGVEQLEAVLGPNLADMLGDDDHDE